MLHEAGLCCISQHFKGIGRKPQSCGVCLLDHIINEILTRQSRYSISADLQSVRRLEAKNTLCLGGPLKRTENER